MGRLAAPDFKFDHTLPGSVHDHAYKLGSGDGSYGGWLKCEGAKEQLAKELASPPTRKLSAPSPAANGLGTTDLKPQLQTLPLAGTKGS